MIKVGSAGVHEFIHANARMHKLIYKKIWLNFKRWKAIHFFQFLPSFIQILEFNTAVISYGY